MLRLLPLMLMLALASSTINHCESTSEWQMLTKGNFSSQIQLHPYILLFVTLPWSGESRSLMRDVEGEVANKAEEFRSLKLMFMNRNTEKMLADSIGATSEAVTVFYFHYSISYKYRGRLRAKNILSSIYRCISLAPEEVPLKALKTPEQLISFLDSTDEALVLVDFCGWTPKLLARRKKNETESGFGDHLGGNDIIPVSRRRKNQKVDGSMENMCKAEFTISKGLSEIPWLVAVASVNDSALEGAVDGDPYVTSSCNSEEYQRFHSFYLKFMISAREFFLPPERRRFGLILERSMLSSLGVGDSGSWYVVHYLTGCPDCSKILREEDDLNHVLQMDNYFVKQLEGNGHDQEPNLPANKPSVLLFVDRSSDSSETRGRSWESLHVFREVAHHYHVLNQMVTKDNDKHGKVSVQGYRGLKSISEHPRLKLSMAAQKIKLKDMSTIMIVNDGKQVSLDKVAPDLQVGSLNELVGYILQQKKDGKLSSLAKDLGFQLLSDDIDVKSVNTQQAQSEVQYSEMSPETSLEDQRGAANPDEDLYGPSGRSVGGPKEKAELTGLSSQNEEVKVTFSERSNEIDSAEPEETVADHRFLIAKNMKAETETSEGNKSGEEQDNVVGFYGSFFYFDGNYRLLKTLTGGNRIPNVVIIDPSQQQHYVFPEEKNFNSSSLHDFLSGFLNGTLHTYQRSEQVLQASKEASRPPFVNLDFHEVDSIPRITAHTFPKLVIGFNLSEKENVSHAWNEDVLVLFSNSWCGFCQRMELIVREVYRMVKGYVDALKSGPRIAKTPPDCEEMSYVTMKLPRIYLLDCTLNDCDLILKSVDQMGVYPALILFPAKKKIPLPYGGEMAVVNIIKFAAEHGSNFNNLIRERVLRLFERRNPNQNQHKHASDSHETPLDVNKFYYEDRTVDKVASSSQIKLPVSYRFQETSPHVVIGSVLIATESLLGVQPFDGSKILIVAASQINGFQGLIINKLIEWSSLNELRDDLKVLKHAPLSFGGPVVASGMPLVALTRTASRNSLPEILPGVYYLDQLETMKKIEELKTENQSVSDYWFFLGFSSWGWNQLFTEMARGAWNLSNDGIRHLSWP